MDVDLGDVHVLGLQPAPCSSSTRSACTGSLPPASSPRGTREAFVLSNSNRPTSINCVHGFVNLRLSSHLFHNLGFFQWELIFVRHYHTGACRLRPVSFGSYTLGRGRLADMCSGVDTFLVSLRDGEPSCLSLRGGGLSGRGAWSPAISVWDFIFFVRPCTDITCVWRYSGPAGKVHSDWGP